MNIAKKLQLAARRHVLAMLAGLHVAWILMPTKAHAASGIGSWATNLVSEFKLIAKIVVPGATLIGIGMIFFGLLKIVESKKTHQPIGGACLSIGIGVILTGITVFTGALSASIGGGNDMATNNLSSLGIGN